ncbi:MAG: hypothetical protein EA378_10530 [Phycisphaerales bacterium]|nr:MAG: hypothetical protein EA378_10530 [Phycisphaerales bacterium]
MQISKLTTAAMVVAAASAGASASVINSHIGIDVVNGNLSTQAWQSGVGYLGESRVFVQTIDPATFFRPDPGTNSPGGTFATPGAIGFNIVDTLKVWNPATERFDAADETMTIGFGTDPIFGGFIQSATTDSGFVPGFATNVRDETSHPTNSGQWGRHHIHHTFQLSGAGSANPADGVFLLNLELYYEPGAGNDVTYGDSKPFWLVFGLNSTEGELGFVRDYVQNVIVPAPGVGAVLALAGLAGVRRRRA